MQIANIMLRLGGDEGNTISKFAVTPAEIAVLRVIHGENSVYDIEPIGEIDRTDRYERQRLAEIYGQRQADGTSLAKAVDSLFPGAAARVFHELEELDLPEEFFKPETRVGLKPKAQAVAEDVKAEKPAKPAKGKKADKKAAASEPTPTPQPEEEGGEEDDEDDGIKDMDPLA
jgi:hypothetical protein